MNRSFPETLTRLVLIGLCLVVSVPLFVLSFYNHPSVVDDYCFANTARHFGFWTAQQMYYDGWTGRFFHNFLVHSSPLTIGWYGGYKVYPIVLLVLLGISFYQLSRVSLPGVNILTRLAAAAGLMLYFLTTLASLPEFMYWYAGMACYSLACVCFLFLLASLIVHQRHGFRVASGYTVIESLLIIAIIGSSETSMVMVVSVLAMLVLGELVLYRRLSATCLTLLVVGAIGCYYLISAPGNAIRMGSNPNSRNVLGTLLEATHYGAGYFVRQLLTTPLIPLTVLYVPIATRLLHRETIPPYLRMPPVLVLAYWLLTLLALISLHFYAVGVPPVARLINLINLIWILGWFYSITVLLRAGQSSWSRLHLTARQQTIGWSLALLWLIYAGVMNPIVGLVYSDLSHNRPQEYNRAMNKRYRLMAAARPTDTVSLDSLPMPPASLFMEDIRTNPEHLWNRCWAEYFNRKSVVLTTK